MRVTCLSSANTTQGGYTSSTEKKKTIPEKCTSNNNDEKSMSDKKLSPSAPTEEKKILVRVSIHMKSIHNICNKSTI